MTLPIPSAQSKLVDAQGRPSNPWMEWFRSLVGKPEAIAIVPAGPSPFTYTASKRGALAIVGGTVSAISLQRSRVTLTLAANSGLVPVANGDQITITYSVPPALSFVPW